MQNLTLDLTQGTDQLTGTVWINHAPLSLRADRAYWGPHSELFPDAGQYTMVLPGDVDDPNKPDGDGFATVTVTPRGVVRVRGRLADNRVLAVRGAVSKNGQWPLFASLYRGAGVVIGWVNFPDAAQTSVTWIKGWLPGEKLYENGFFMRFDPVLTPYAPPEMGETMRVVLEGGGFFDEPATGSATVDARGRLVAVADELNLRISLNGRNGAFRGSFAHPETRRAVRFSGVCTGAGHGGAGFFVNGAVSGRVRLESSTEQQ